MRNKKIKIIDRCLLNHLTIQAKANSRLRKNYNLHPSDDFCCHRLFNAIEPGSYIPPHRHLDPLKDETFVIIQGRLGVITFDESGNVIDHTELIAGGDTLALDIPHGLFHTAVSLTTGTIFFEAKAGPYLLFDEAEKAQWAPNDGDSATITYLTSLTTLFL